ncbi:MAG TPA: pilus assembly protein N-terminal domain-containing protein [Polyangiaceae bacterium]|nr:pilus assembly protein N-terminal domain-containing protein [Polyangiaceae bacterium]
MRRIGAFAWLLLFALVLAAPRAAAQPARGGPAGPPAPDRTEELDLAVGENKTIPANGVLNYSEGSPGVADVKLTTDGGQFVIVGLKAGSTTLLLIFRDGSKKNWVINVFARSPDQVETELQQLLQGSVGVHLRRIGARFFVEGGVSTEADMKRYQQIAALYPGQVESLVQVGSVAQDRVFNIRIDFFFAQFNRDSGYDVGLEWPAQIGNATALGSTFTYDFVAHAVTTATATVTNQPLPFLDLAAHRGWAKVLRQATLITGNGNEAKFSNGGEENFQVSNNLTANIRAIEFGVNLTVLPRFDRDTKDMEVKIVADVGDLTPASAGTNLPGRNTAKLETIVHLKLGQSIVLSGIASRSTRHETTGIPILSDIPVLGLLFGSHTNEVADADGVIFIIPSVIDTLPPASMSLIEGIAKTYDHFSGDLEKTTTFARTPPVLGAPASH